MSLFWKPGSEVPEHVSFPPSSSKKNSSDINDGNLYNGEEEEEDDIGLAENFIYSKDTNPTIGLQKSKEALPIYAQLNELLYIFETSSVSIVSEEFDDGNALEITRYLYEHSPEYLNKKIACVIPSKSNVLQVKERFIEELCILNENVFPEEIGIFSEPKDPPLTNPTEKVIFATFSDFLRQLFADPLLTDYSVIVLGWAWGRVGADMELFMALCKRILVHRTDIRLIISTSPFNVDDLTNFFAASRTCKNIHIPSRLSAPEMNFLDQSLANNDYIQNIRDTLVDMMAAYGVDGHKTRVDGGDILVFLPGKKEIEKLYDLIACEESLKCFQILPLCASVCKEDREHVLRPDSGKAPKIILATNIAQNLSKIANVRIVIDSGLERCRIFDPTLGLYHLCTQRISKESAMQRAQRSSLHGKRGRVYCLYTHRTHQSFIDKDSTDLKTQDSTNTILKMLYLGFKRISDLYFPFTKELPPGNCIFAFEKLFLLGAINGSGGLTEDGRKMALLPIEPVELCKLLLEAFLLDCCREEAIIMLAMMQANPIKKTKPSLFVKEGDLISAINIYRKFKSLEVKERRSWCDRSFVSLTRMERVDDLIALYGDLWMRKLSNNHKKHPNPPCNDGQVKFILECICRSLFLNAACLQEDGSYRTIYFNSIVYVHPTSIFINNPPPYLLYTDCVATDKVYIKGLTSITAEMLLTCKPFFFKS